MSTDERTIRVRITSKPGQEPYRARMEGTKVIATAMASEELAVLAVANKVWKHQGDITHTRHLRGNLWIASLDQQACYVEGDRIRYQTEGMDAPLEAAIGKVDATGVQLDGKGSAVFVRWHEIIGRPSRSEYPTDLPAPPADTPPVDGSVCGDCAMHGLHSSPDSCKGSPEAPACNGFRQAPAQDASGGLEGLNTPPPAGAEGQSPTLASVSPSQSLTATGRSDVTATPVLAEIVRQLPVQIDDCTTAIKHFISEERLCGVRSAMLIAHARATWWPAKDDNQKFLAWAHDAFALNERQIYDYLRAGRMLLRPAVRSQVVEIQNRLLLCHVSKLVLLDQFTEPDLYHWLKDNDPSAISRDDLAEQVAAEVAKRDGKQLPAGKSGAKRDDPVLRLEAFCGEAEKIVSGKAVAIGDAVMTRANPGKLLVGGISLAMMGIRAEKNRHALKADDLTDAREYVRGILADLEALIAGV